MQVYQKIYQAVIRLLYIITTKKDVWLLQTYWAMKITVYRGVIKSTLNQKLQLEKGRETVKWCKYILPRPKMERIYLTRQDSNQSTWHICTNICCNLSKTLFPSSTIVISELFKNLKVMHLHNYYHNRTYSIIMCNVTKLTFSSFRAVVWE